MRKITVLFFFFPLLLFFNKIKPMYAPLLIEGAELAAQYCPEAINLAHMTYPIVKNDVWQVAENILSKIKPIAHHEIYSLYHKKRKFRSPKIKHLQDFQPKFNLLAPINNCAQVDTSLQKSQWEKDYFSKKHETIRHAINNLTGNTNTNLYGSIDTLNEQNSPIISFVLSGGGYRAMIMSLGFMLGASKITSNGYSLIDATSYVASLSGSTWFLGLMLILNNYLQFQPNTIEGYLHAIKDYLQGAVACDFWNVETMNLKAIEHHLLQKFLNNEGSVQVSDLWGAILTDRLFKNLNLNGAEQDITFGLARHTLETSIASPFPIFTCDICNYWPYYCMETNPYTTGFVNFHSRCGGFIQTNYFESPFNGGQSQKLFPEESLGSFLGIFGSAYSASLGDILNELKTESTSEWFKNFVTWVEKKLPLYKDRVLRANVDNFMYGMNGYPCGNLEKITVADGGMSMINLPFIPLYTQNRGVDIFIVCDASDNSTSSGYPELKEMADYAKAYCLPFPSLTNPTVYPIKDPVTNQFYKVSVFQYDNYPTIIYFPCYTPESTIKFNYSNEEFENVCETTERMVAGSRQIIIQAIREKQNKSLDWFGDLEINSPSKFIQLGRFVKNVATSTARLCVGLDDDYKNYEGIN